MLFGASAANIEIDGAQLRPGRKRDEIPGQPNALSTQGLRADRLTGDESRPERQYRDRRRKPFGRPWNPCRLIDRLGGNNPTIVSYECSTATMKRLITIAVSAAAATLAVAQDATGPIGISVLGRTIDPAGRSFVSVQVTNTAAQPYQFSYFSLAPSGSGWSHARQQWGGGNTAGAGSAHYLRAGTATNFPVLVPRGEQRWRVQVRYKPLDGSEREKYTSTADIVESDK